MAATRTRRFTREDTTPAEAPTARPSADPGVGPNAAPSIGLLVGRVVVGFIMSAHGWQKLFDTGPATFGRQALDRSASRRPWPPATS
jgi:hypothetical protein